MKKMEKKIITIGRAPDNDKIFNMPDVSGHHARIYCLGEGKYKVEDVDSANGVYVNGYRIKTAIVSADDQVRLSAKLVIDVPALFGLKGEKDRKSNQDKEKKVNPKDFTAEFSRLEKIHDEYYDRLDKMEDREQIKQVIMRMGFMAIPLLLALWGQKTIAGASLVLATIPQLFIKRSKIRKKRQEMIDDFMRSFSCPNKQCSQMLYGRSWRVWHDTGECPRCKAIYNKNKL